MKKLTIDIETRSSIDITLSGLYKYAESSDFDILLFSVSIDDGDVVTYDLASGEQLPDEIIRAMTDTAIAKRAFHVNFERVCISVYLRRNYPDLLENRIGSYLPPEGWYCDMVQVRYFGLPSSLKEVGNVLGIDRMKLDSGKNLIKYFCTPNKDGTFHAPSDAPDQWEEFKAYNKRDVEAEMEIQDELDTETVPDFIWKEFFLDQAINDRGILIDKEFAEKAIILNADEKSKILSEMKALTELGNPNSVAQMKEWLKQKDIIVSSLDKKSVEKLMPTVPDDVKEVLKLRQKLSKSSVKKYEAMIHAACADHRARGMFSFYGASRTGRFSGRLIQLQNLPQNHFNDLEASKRLIKAGAYDQLREAHEDVTDVLSQLIRTALIPPEGKKYIVADFSAIEARVIAWLAGEQWRIDAFANGEDIYCTSASRIFGVKVEKNGEHAELRQKGKVAELACAYGDSVGAMKNMGGSDLKLTDEELKKLVEDWRKASPNIVHLWHEVGSMAVKAIKQQCEVYAHGLTISKEESHLFITLPSGRKLSYCTPVVKKDDFGRDRIFYAGVDSSKKWAVMDTYGAKLVENIVQGIARDILLYAMQNLSDYRIVAHVHDEIIIEAEKNVSVESICKIMSQTPEWAEGLLLRADGYECDFYMKS